MTKYGIVYRNGAVVGQDGTVKSRISEGQLSDADRMARHNRSAMPFPGTAALSNTSPTSGFRPISFQPKSK